MALHFADCTNMSGAGKAVESKESKGSADGAASAELALKYRQVTAEDLSRVHALEAAGYPEDGAPLWLCPRCSSTMMVAEAASLQSLTYRCKNANDFFLVAEAEKGGKQTIVAFVCGTLTAERKLTHDSMFEHNSEGDNAVICCWLTNGVCAGTPCRAVFVRAQRMRGRRCAAAEARVAHHAGGSGCGCCLRSWPDSHWHVSQAFIKHLRSKHGELKSVLLIAKQVLAACVPDWWSLTHCSFARTSSHSTRVPALHWSGNRTSCTERKSGSSWNLF